MLGKRAWQEHEISLKMEGLALIPPISSLGKENAAADSAPTSLPHEKIASTSLSRIIKSSEEGLSEMKKQMKASRFPLLSNFIVNYYLSQGRLEHVPKGWKQSYVRTVVRGIVRFAVNYDITESKVVSSITQYVTLHGLPADEKEIADFIAQNS